ncbi:MAG: BTAD domain-containing putative transcriptional regulator [Chloroflexi bacterium OHK40]
MVRLYLFGAPQLERDGTALPLRRGKGLALLAYLATTARPHSREALIALLWPEFPEVNGRNNLRRELSQLRALLGEDLLVADRRQVAWCASPAHWVDVAAFSAQVAAARSRMQGELLDPQGASALSSAVQLAPAEFLEGVHLADSPTFEEWLFFQREELRQQLGWALEALVGWHDERGELSAAQQFARRWLSLDPLNEPPRRALMRLTAELGQYAAALRVYEEGARLLDAELGATPEAATTALYAAIKDRELAPASPRPAAAPPASAPSLSPRAPGGAQVPPQPLTSFVGRQRDIETLVQQLNDPACRLLTLVGPGGIGKTRLALELATHCRATFTDGVAIIALDSLTVPAHVPGAIAAALGLVLPGSGDGWQALAAALRGRAQLLVLDNLEQLAGAAAAALATLLRSAPGLTLLVTSREALRLPEEWLWTVGGLEMPAVDDPAVVAASDAVQLFVARAHQRGGARTLSGELDRIAAICRLVGGMPLAIELAAAWTQTLSCAEIAAELAAGMALLATDLQGVPERHRSIQTVLDQTWKGLAPALQLALARLALLPAGATRELAAAVAAAAPPVLAQLVERALVARGVDDRYQIHPLVRQYARQRLRELPAEERAAAAAGGRFFVQFLSEQFVRSKAGASAEASATIRPELENIRSLLPAMLAQATGEPLRQALQILQDVYFHRGPYQEGAELQAMAEASLRERGDDAEDVIVRAHVLTSMGLFAVRQGKLGAAREHFTASQALFAALGATPRLGDATDPEIGIGLLALIAGDYQAASHAAERVRLRNTASGQPRNVMYSWYLRTEAAQAQGLLAAARTAARNGLALAHTTRAVWFGAYIRNQLGQIAVALGRYDEAEGHFAASHTTRAAFDDREGMALALLGLGACATHQGDATLAAERYAESLRLYQQTGDRGGTARAQLGLAAAYTRLGQYGRAWALVQAALDGARVIAYQHVLLDGLVHAAAILHATGEGAEAAPLLAQALTHPASRTETMTQAQGLLARCEEQLTPQAFAAAVTRGRGTILETLVDEILTLPAVVGGCGALTRASPRSDRSVNSQCRRPERHPRAARGGG